MSELSESTWFRASLVVNNVKVLRHVWPTTWERKTQSRNSLFISLCMHASQDTMDQSKMDKMDGTVMAWTRMMLDYPKVQTQAYVESKPKRQRPTHQGEFSWRQRVLPFAHIKLQSYYEIIIPFTNRPGRMRDSLERSGTKTKDPVQLQKRLGLFSGIALIVGTMIGGFNQLFF